MFAFNGSVEMEKQNSTKKEINELEQNTVYLLDYGEKGFIIRMPEDLPRRADPKKVKVVRIEMPEDAEYPEPKAKH